MAKIDGRTLSHETNEHLRILAVRRVIEDGEAPSAVMKSMGLHRTTIYRWLKRHAREGMEGLKSSKAKGPEPKLSDRQCQRIRSWIVGKDPRQFGFDFGLWTRRIVQEMIAERLKVSVSLTTVGTILSRLQITPQKPLRRAYERDPEAVAQWVEKDYPRLRRRAKANAAQIFFLDEAGFTSEPTLGKTYGLKGQTPVVSTTGQRQRVNAISAVNARGAFWSSVYTGRLNAQSFVTFLRDFMKGRKSKVYLVVDGHPSHKARLVRDYVQSTKGRLELHFLPPYAPDLNPDEFVWQHAKTNGVAKKPLRRNESLRERVEKDMAAIRADKSLVRSFFRAPSVAYAADY